MQLKKLIPLIKKGGNVHVFVPVAGGHGVLGGGYAQIVKSTLLESLDSVPMTAEFVVNQMPDGVYIGGPAPHEKTVTLGA